MLQSQHGQSAQIYLAEQSGQTPVGIQEIAVCSQQILKEIPGRHSA